MKIEQVSNNCFAVLNEKNRVCDANSGLINLGGGMALSYFPTFVSESEFVGDTFPTQPSNLNRDLQQLLATGGRLELARDSHARKAQRLAVEVRVDAEASRAEQFMLGGFHVMEK